MNQSPGDRERMVLRDIGVQASPSKAGCQASDDRRRRLAAHGRSRELRGAGPRRHGLRRPGALRRMSAARKKAGRARDYRQCQQEASTFGHHYGLRPARALRTGALAATARPPSTSRTRRNVPAVPILSERRHATDLPKTAVRLDFAFPSGPFSMNVRGLSIRSNVSVVPVLLGARIAGTSGRQTASC